MKEFEMKLSTETINILKNFSAINPSVVLKKGKEQSTISPSKAVLAIAVIEEEIPVDFAIYDLNSYLANISQGDDPEINIHSDRTEIVDHGTFAFSACAPNLVQSPPAKKLSVENPTATFPLPSKTIQHMLAYSSINNLKTISIIGKNGKIEVSVHEGGNPKSNSWRRPLGETSKEFTVAFAVENMKIITTDYNVDVFEDRGYARLVSTNGKLTYFIALEV
jgi:hypothetical protein